MALAIGTSPALVSSATSATTASFTRPADGLLVALVSAVSETAPVVSGTLTWTRQVRNNPSSSNVYSEIWTAPVTGSGSMTVTATITGSSFTAVGLKVLCVTGHNASNPIGANGTGTSTTNALTANGYTSTVANSRGFFTALEFNALGNPTSTDTGFGWTVNSGFPVASGIAVHKAANTSTSGSTVTFNADAAGSSAADWTWAALEIVPASDTVSVELTTVAVAATVPTPAVAVNSSPVPATVTAAAAMPTPAVSFGAGAHPDPIAVTAEMPTLTVTTEDVELAALDTIDVAAAMPGPAVQIGADATLATIAAVVAMYDPAVQIHAEATLATIAVGAAMPAPIVDVPVLPGDQITRSGQIEWNGFLLGNGTPYSWQELTGWRDTPPIISGNVDQPLGHGSYPGQAYAGERTINWQTRLQAPDGQLASALRDLIQATGIPQTEEEGYLVVWDLDGAEPYLVQAHLAERKPGPINRMVLFDQMTGALQWVASDPRLYSVIRHSATIPIDSEISILNDGNDASPEIIRIPGPVVTPQIENNTLNRVIGFDVTIASGHFLEIDVKNGNVVDGADDKLSTLIEGSVSIKDFTLGPGPNALLYSAESGGSSMEVLWRHANS